MQEMDAGEVFNWMAYEMTEDPDKRKQLMQEIQQEQSKSMTDEERIKAIKSLLFIASGNK